MTSPLSRKLAFDNEFGALLLQGGGALGAYRPRVFEELLAIDIEPKWVPGVSIGAIDAALIAGNAPEHRLDRAGAGRVARPSRPACGRRHAACAAGRYRVPGLPARRESASKDCEFSRPSMLEHRAGGVADMRRTHHHPDWLQGSTIDDDATVYDLAQGYEAAPSSKDEPDHDEKVALVRASKVLASKPSMHGPSPGGARKTPRRSTPRSAMPASRPSKA